MLPLFFLCHLPSSDRQADTEGSGQLSDFCLLWEVDISQTGCRESVVYCKMENADHVEDIEATEWDCDKCLMWHVLCYNPNKKAKKIKTKQANTLSVFLSPCFLFMVDPKAGVLKVRPKNLNSL